MRRGVGARRLERHLLAEHHPQGQLLLVDGSRDPLPGRLGHQCAQIRVRAERVDDRLGVRVEVEQSPAPGDRRGQIAEVVQHQRALHVIGIRCETDDSAAVGQPQRPPVGTVADLFDAWHRAGREMAEQPLVGERRPHRQPQRQRARGAHVVAPESAPCTFTQRGRRQIAYRPHGVVELPDAGEAGGEGDVAERQLGGLDQYARGLRALRSGQGQRVGADLGLQQPLELPSGVADAGGESGHAVAVDGAVGDESHRPRHDVTAHIPLRRTR